MNQNYTVAFVIVVGILVSFLVSSIFYSKIMSDTERTTKQLMSLADSSKGSTYSIKLDKEAISWYKSSEFYIGMMTLIVTLFAVMVAILEFYSFQSNKRNLEHMESRLLSRVEEQAQNVQHKISILVSFSRFSYESTVKAFSTLRDYYHDYRELTSNLGTLGGQIDQGSIRDLCSRLDSVYELYRIETQHVRLFSPDIEDVELAMREIHGMSNPCSIKHLKDFIQFRLSDDSFIRLVKQANHVIECIERTGRANQITKLNLTV